MANILLVDDDVENLWSLQVALEGDSHRVSVAGDVRRALDILRRNPIQCIVTDYEMPEIDGVEFCRIVRSQRAHCALPIVMMSASPELTHTPPFWNRFLRKPASFEDLISVIEEHTAAPLPGPASWQRRNAAASMRASLQCEHPPASRWPPVSARCWP